MDTLDNTLFDLGIYSERRCIAINVAVELLRARPSVKNRLIADFYTEIGRQCGCDWDAAAHRIRMASISAWEANPALLNDLAGRTLSGPPSASEFAWILSRSTM